MNKLKYIWIVNSIIVSSWLFYIFIIPMVLKNRNVIIPDINGLSEKAAVDKLKDYSLDVSIYYINGSGDDEALYTLPIKDTKVKNGSNVNLYISKKQENYYEEFIGLILDSNIDMINNYCISNGIAYNVEYVLDNESIPGMIINQSKKKSDKVNKGDVLIFTIAKSDLYLQMPNLVGMSIYDALKILDSYNLKANIIYYHAPIDVDIIIFQSIGVGNTIKKGNSYPIDIYVSKGLELDIAIDYNNFIKVLSILDITYDIIYIESNEDSNTCLGYKGFSLDNNLHYYIYISK